MSPSLPISPSSVRRSCKQPGCGGFAAAGSGFCQKHAPAARAMSAAKREQFDRTRGSAAARGYDGRWQKARRTFLAKHAYRCEGFNVERCLTPASVVDHIKPHRGDRKLFWDQDNWQCLCKPCHDRKTATEDGGFRGASNPPASPGPATVDLCYL